MLAELNCVTYFELALERNLQKFPYNIMFLLEFCGKSAAQSNKKLLHNGVKGSIIIINWLTKNLVNSLRLVKVCGGLSSQTEHNDCFRSTTIG